MSPAIGIYAAILGLLAGVLTLNVIRHRIRHRVETGDGGFAGLKQALRAHGNFVEHAPITLFVIAIAEAAGARESVIHVLGIMLVVARVTSAWGLSQSIGQSRLRQISGALTLLLLFIAPLVLLAAVFGLR